MSPAALAFAAVKGKKREAALGTAANTLLALGLPCWEVRPAAPLLSRQDLMRRFVFRVWSWITAQPRTRVWSGCELR